MPALEPSIIKSIWEQFSALLPEREVDHPLGCHRSRIPDRVVFEKLVKGFGVRLRLLAHLLRRMGVESLPGGRIPPVPGVRGGRSGLRENLCRAAPGSFWGACSRGAMLGSGRSAAHRSGDFGGAGSRISLPRRVRGLGEDVRECFCHTTYAFSGPIMEPHER